MRIVCNYPPIIPMTLNCWQINNIANVADSCEGDLYCTENLVNLFLFNVLLDSHDVTLGQSNIVISLVVFEC